jgi:hypothetical protein
VVTVCADRTEVPRPGQRPAEETERLQRGADPIAHGRCWGDERGQRQHGAGRLGMVGEPSEPTGACGSGSWPTCGFGPDQLTSWCVIAGDVFLLYQPVPTLSGRLTVRLGIPRVELPPTSAGLLRQPGGEGLSPHSIPRRLVAHPLDTTSAATSCSAPPPQQPSSSGSARDRPDKS